MDFEKRVANKRMPAQKSVRFSFFSQPSIVHRLNKNIFDQSMFKLQWFKEGRLEKPETEIRIGTGMRTGAGTGNDNATGTVM